jgi:Anti-sigma regulatory factor (Ser/Thr protein kinase)
MAMTRLRFQPIQGKSLDIIDAIVKTEEVASVVKNWAMLSVVVEELVVNIVDYAHSDYLDVEIVRDKKCIILRFHDGGVPFNPLKKPSPSFSIPMEHRKIGGLGIFLVIQKAEHIEYEYTQGENVLTVSLKI